MKKALTILTALGCVSLIGCSDYQLLGLGGDSDGTGPMTAQQFASSECVDQVAPEGGILEVAAEMGPEAYSGGALRMDILLGIGSTITHPETEIGFFVHHVAAGNEVVEEADLTGHVDWQISLDGTAAGASLCAPNGLHAGVYEFAAYVAGVLEWEGQLFEAAADTGVRYEVEGEGEGEDEPPHEEEGGGEGEPGGEGEGGGEEDPI